MKAIPSFRHAIGRYVLAVLNLLLTLVLTVLSFRYVQPKDCYRLCDLKEGVPCPAGSCRVGEQKAGWPIPVFIDAPSPSSPRLPGRLGADDYPHPVSMFVDVMFYSVLVWLTVLILGILRGQILNPKLIFLALPMNVVLALFLWGYYFVTGYVRH